MGAGIRLRKTVRSAAIKRTGTSSIVGKVKRIKKKNFEDPRHCAEPKFVAMFDKEKSWLDNLKTCNLGEIYADRVPDAIPEKAAWTISKLSEEDLDALKKLTAVHGGNITRMRFDRKLNKYQWTENQIERKLALLAEGRIHVCELGKCLCGETANSSNVQRKNRYKGANIYK